MIYWTAEWAMKFKNIFKIIQYHISRQDGRFWHYTIDFSDVLGPAHVDVDDAEIDFLMTYDIDLEYYIYLLPFDQNLQ